MTNLLGLPRWLSVLKIHLPMQESQETETQVQSLYYLISSNLIEARAPNFPVNILCRVSKDPRHPRAFQGCSTAHLSIP